MTADPGLARQYANLGFDLGPAVGQGGFGRVHRAQHLRLDVDVALKVLDARHAQDPELVQLFFEEARTMARLDHPHLLRVYDVFHGPEGPTLVTEWMGGGSLRSPVASLDELLAVARAVTAGLQEMHSAQLVHRDIKPENILRRERDAYPKLGDFGIAARFDKTMDPGRIVGTPPYMAPECFAGASRAGPPADVYALGVSLFELWLGARPFEDGPFFPLVAKIAEGKFDRRLEERPGLPLKFADLVRAMTAREPAHRPTPDAILARLAEGLDVSPALAAASERVGAWRLLERIYASSNWLGYLAHHVTTGRAARLSILGESSRLDADLVLESAARASEWSHAGLTRVFDWGRRDGRPFVVFGSLGHSLDAQVTASGPLSEPEALQLLVDLGSAVAYLVGEGYAYQMIEPGSIHARAEHDRGWMLGWPCYSVPLGSGVGGRRVFVPAYAAPEIRSSSAFGSETDVYGLGASAFFALTASTPDSASLATLAGVTAPTRQLVASMLDHDPAARPPAIEVAHRATRILSALRA